MDEFASSLTPDTLLGKTVSFPAGMEVALYERNEYSTANTDTCAWKIVLEHQPYSFKPPPIILIAGHRGLMDSDQPMAMVNISFPEADP